MKKVWQIISVVLVLVLALSMTAFAEEDAAVVAMFAVGTVEAEPGEIVEVPVTLKVTEAADLASLVFEVDEAKLSIVDFEFADELKAVINTQVSNYNVPNKSAVAMFNTPQAYDGAYGILKLKVEADVEKGDIEVAAISNVKNASMAVIASSVNPGKVTVTGMTSAERKQDVIVLKLNAATAYTFGKTEAIDPDNSKVVPYLKNDRTLVPLRFVSETLGAEVKWETGWNYCYVVKGDKEIKITFNSADIEVNGQVVTYDAPVEVVQDRTMVPIRFISEELGYDVKWNQANQLVIITPADNPWVEDRQVEKDVLEGVLVTFLFNGIF